MASQVTGSSLFLNYEDSVKIAITEIVEPIHFVQLGNRREENPSKTIPETIQDGESPEPFGNVPLMVLHLFPLLNVVRKVMSELEI